MKRKILTIIILIGLIIALCIPRISFGTGENGAFLKSNKTKVAPGNTITMTIDLSKISYEEFEFTLSSSISIEELTTDEQNVDTSLSGNSLKISGVKSEINMQQIELYYKVPESVSVGSTITLTGKIEPTDSSVTSTAAVETHLLAEEIVEVDNESVEESSGVSENIDSDQLEETVENNSDEDSTQSEEVLEMPKEDNNSAIDTAQEVTIKIQVVDSSEDIEEDSDKEKNMDDKEMSDKDKNMDKNMSDKDMEDKDMEQEKSGSSKSSSSVTVDSEDTVTYNGDSNNYLSSLSVDGYELSPAFLKTSNTYFIEVENDISDITVNATAEDSTATVTVYGNTNLQEGKNKVLISVTADNGDVKTYRIYVTKGGSDEK